MGCRGSRITPFVGTVPLPVTGCFLSPGSGQGVGWPVGAKA